MDAATYFCEDQASASDNEGEMDEDFEEGNISDLIEEERDIYQGNHLACDNRDRATMDNKDNAEMKEYVRGLNSRYGTHRHTNCTLHNTRTYIHICNCVRATQVCFCKPS